jgi:DUF4097 and DUF4098 domain-containing protein YvlB
MTSTSRRVALATAIAALYALPASGQASRGPDTDQTVPVTRGTRLLLNNFAGEVVVRGWDRDQLQIRARHSSRTRVTIRPDDGTVRVSSSSSSGTSAVDYEVAAPAWMPLRISGTFTYIETSGVQADINAETVRGDIQIKGGSGVIALKSIEGEVQVDGAQGRITVSSVNEGVFVLRSKGDINAETVNGEIRITDSSANSADATTVNGDVVYTGTVADNGLYRFSTHQGDIVLGLPDKLNATVTVRTYQGEFESSFPIKAGEARRGRRQTFTLGTGAAQIELESFGGEISVRRASEVSSTRDREKHP